MKQLHHRWDSKIKEQRRHEMFREMAKIENDYYDGDATQFEYSKAISALLKDPVSLGLVGGISNRGFQR